VPSPYAGDASRLVVMGAIVGAFGIQGWIKVKPFSENAGALGGFGTWVVRTKQGWQAMPLEDFEVHSKGPVAKLAGVAGREGAQGLRGCEVAVEREALGPAREGELYQVDLVGFEVRDVAGEKLGQLESFFETGETSVMVVRGERERLIPFVAQYVTSVEREARRITVDWKADYDA
jgi:16S rRNA processing protein RimM